ncbi:hypothetical protein [Cellulomonas sp. Root137]|uniref:hypothetical protein n=1 Tax=Cellulomonas sp. Root137 TaxID=1736459 RepID=UPI0006F51362|nr:hypothetical protein [Cellulomonas sp. Root137]KQY44427.1 hypothetical protein ASD18_12920 [Cellulomonas sp. Root137]
MGADDRLVLNGIDAGTGAYLAPSVGIADLAGYLRDGAPPVGSQALRRRRHDDEAHLGVAWGFDPDDLSSVGWGVVVAPGTDRDVLDAVEPLLRLREEQAGDRFRRLEAREGESKDDFLARHGAGPGVVDPRKVPYFLLLLGSPEQLSFELQYQLGVAYAVGRLDLPDAAAYASYVAAVLRAESEPAADAPARHLHLFATRHPADTPTGLSSSRLVEPLVADVGERALAWQVTADVGAGATKERLLDLVTSPTGPDVLFTAGHGLGGETATSQDVAGALLCQDWPGPLGPAGPISPDHFVAAADVGTGVSARPRVVFSFACFGAGTPRVSDYPGIGSAPPGRSFTAPLAQALLTAGALAFVGHVDRAWTCSFLWKGLSAQVMPFSSTLLALMDGARLGLAMESISSRYAEVATELTTRLAESRRLGTVIEDVDLVGLWTATHDARGYVVLGDPAVRVAPRGAAGLRRR